MKRHRLFIIALMVACVSLHADNVLQKIIASAGVYQYCPKQPMIPLHDIKDLLYKPGNTLNNAVIEKVLAILKCARHYNIERTNILTIIDYSLPASEKRLWIFDLKEKKLLFHTYVSHGIKSGALLSTLFSNKYDSKSSSLGVYRTAETYHGRDGLSLRLDGLDNGFNSNASNRYIVMHGGWYVNEHFIKKYGRAGRSWGCPAVPLDLTESIINTIKDKTLLIAYYPSDTWFSKSKFLKCNKLPSATNTTTQNTIVNPVTDDSVKRDDILFTDIRKHSNSEENTVVAVMSADSYKRVFQIAAPLNRMLRRQVDNNEYIALSATEFKNIKTLNDICFVRPTIKMIKGYYETQMQILNLGKIKSISLNGTTGYTVYFESKNTINLKPTDRFIRWLGL